MQRRCAAALALLFAAAACQVHVGHASFAVEMGGLKVGVQSCTRAPLLLRASLAMLHRAAAVAAPAEVRLLPSAV
jgi:hypothetical protein